MRQWGTSILLCGLALVPGVSSMQERRIVTVGEPPAGPYSSAVVVDRLVFVSAVTGTGGPGDPASDIQAQTRRALDRLTRVLDAAGSSLAQTVAINLFLKRASDFDAMNAVYREAFPKDPPARTTVVTDLPEGALVAMSATAVPNGAAREPLHPAGWMKSPRPYSYIVRAGGLVFLSGLVSRRGSDDQVVPGPVALQTRTILENAGTLLRTAGLSYDDVVAARVFITDDSYFEAMNEEYGKYFDVAPPARATAVTGLMGNDSQVEITLIASTEGKEPIGPLISPTLPVSTAIRAGRRVFFSGVLGDTEANKDDAEAQTREALTRISRTLATAGLSFSDVVDSTVYVPDLWQLAKMDVVFRECFPKDPPARTAVGAKLVVRSGQVEILMTAVK
jgi:2-iminobutanoate/2-iminopropanoate deaminase